MQSVQRRSLTGITALVLLLSLVVSCQSQCPVPIGSGCQCAYLEGRYVMNCRGLQLSAVPRFQPLTILLSELTLSGNQIQKIGSAAFVTTDGSSLRVTRLDLTNNPISNLTSDSLLGLDPSELKELLIDVRSIAFPTATFAPFVSLTTLNVSGFISTSLPSNALQPFTSLKTLKLASSSLTTLLADDVKYQSSTLENLDLSSNRIAAVPSSALSSLSRLKVLSLSSNSLTALLQSSFQGVMALTYLDLSHNSKITRIDTYAFNPLSTSLTNLAMSDCHLDVSLIQPVSVLVGLRKLDLSHNMLASLPTNVFLNMRSLASLSLQWNQLTSLTALTFTGLGSSLMELSLSSNSITTIESGTFASMTSLQNLDIDSQNLSVPLTQPGLFNGLENSLRMLSLQDVKLTSAHLPLLKPLKNLQTLKLEYNLIDTIPDFAFSGMALNMLTVAYNSLTSVTQRQMYGIQNTLSSINFDYNGISTIDECVFKLFKNLTMVSLNNNPLRCDCALLWLHQLQQTTDNLFMAMCDSPDSLKNSALKDLTDSQLTCDPSYVKPVCEVITTPAPSTALPLTDGTTLSNDQVTTTAVHSIGPRKANVYLIVGLSVGAAMLVVIIVVVVVAKLCCCAKKEELPQATMDSRRFNRSDFVRGSQASGAGQTGQTASLLAAERGQGQGPSETRPSGPGPAGKRQTAFGEEDKNQYFEIPDNYYNEEHGESDPDDDKNNTDHETYDEVETGAAPLTNNQPK